MFQEDPAVHPDYTLTLTADGEGNISHDEWAPEEHDLNVRFYLMATGAQSQRRAQMTFTDAKSTSTALTSNNNPSDFGESVTFTATVTCLDTPCIFSHHFSAVSWSYLSRRRWQLQPGDPAFVGHHRDRPHSNDGERQLYYQHSLSGQSLGKSLFRWAEFG